MLGKTYRTLQTISKRDIKNNFHYIFIMTEPEVIEKLKSFKESIIKIKDENKRLVEENLNLRIQIKGYEEAAKTTEAANTAKQAYDIEMAKLIEEAEALLNADNDN